VGSGETAALETVLVGPSRRESAEAWRIVAAQEFLAAYTARHEAWKPIRG